jgi:hypothetical protein
VKFKFILRHFDWLLNINFVVGGKLSYQCLCQAYICKIEPDLRLGLIMLFYLKLCYSISNCVIRFRFQIVLFLIKGERERLKRFVLEENVLNDVKYSNSKTIQCYQDEFISVVGVTVVYGIIYDYVRVIKCVLYIRKIFLYKY